MKSLKKTTLASLVGAAALATAGAANATIVVGGDNGYEFSVDGNINQFFVYTDDNTSGGDQTSEVRNGLLPTFFGFNVSAPEINGLKIGARVSISPSTNAFSYTNGAGGSAMEQREAFATIEGSFGQILAGKALGLYGSHNILTEQTLYGVGYGTGGNGTTTLGGIGFGYDYADWRSQIRWTSPDMNGFKVALAVVDPQGPAINLGPGPTGPISGLTGGNADSEDLRWEGDLSYAGAFDNGSYMMWLSGATQKQDNLAEDMRAWTVGGTLAIAGFEFMGQYSDSENAYAATAASGSVDSTGAIVTTAASPSTKVEYDQFIVQAGYRFAGTTLVSANYTELQDKSSGVGSDDTAERITAGIYHDVNANLKLVAEYTNIENDADTIDQDIFAIGGFVTW